MQPTDSSAPILVTGGSGKTGHRVAQRLTALNLPVRACSRSSAVPFDWDDQTTWEAALAGASAAYVTYAPDLAVPHAVGRIAAFSQQALRQGVRRLVLLSGRGEPGAQRSEQILQRSGAEWTVLRTSWFAQNFSEGPFLEGILAGELALPIGAVREPFIDADDIADAAVAALTQRGHSEQVYELTGPQALTFAEAVGEIGQVSATPVTFRQISMDAFQEELMAQEAPTEIMELMLELFTDVLDGRNAAVTDGVRRILGREPRTFSQYVQDAAAQGAWKRPS